jgi:hypothetical protein
MISLRIMVPASQTQVAETFVLTNCRIIFARRHHTHGLTRLTRIKGRDHEHDPSSDQTR